MKALVLGGGSMKGAYQVGCIKAILENGFEPDMIYGISVGALNATFLVNESGKKNSGRKTTKLAIHRQITFGVLDQQHHQTPGRSAIETTVSSGFQYTDESLRRTTRSKSSPQPDPGNH